MAEVKDIQKLKQRVDSLNSEISRSKGARDEALRNLEEDFEVDSIPAAKKLLTKIERQETKAKEAFETAFEDFEEKWLPRLEK